MPRAALRGTRAANGDRRDGHPGRPGGIVVSHEGDWHGWISDPPSAARDVLVKVCDAYDPPENPRLPRAVDLENVCVRPAIRSLHQGHARREIFLEFPRNLRARLLAHGAISELKFNTLTAELARDRDHPGRLHCQRYFLAWGRKPDSVSP